MVAGVASFYLPGLYVKLRQRARLSAFNARLGDTITMLANSLRSGYSLPQGMDMVAREQPSPVAEEFARVVREIGLGLSTEEALANLVRRVPSEDLDLMVTAINVQHEVGGNLAQILDAIGLTIRERVRIKGEINALTATVRFSGYVVSLMPVALTAILFIIRPEYIMYSVHRRLRLGHGHRGGDLHHQWLLGDAQDRRYRSVGGRRAGMMQVLSVVLAFASVFLIFAGLGPEPAPER